MYNDDIVKFITYVLKSKTTYFPVYVRISGSLQTNFEETHLPTIDSVASYIHLQISVNHKVAIFQNYLYPGALVYYNDKSDLIKMEGDLVSINSILKHGIRVANFTNPEDIEITMKIDDSANFPITTVFKASHKYLVKLNIPISNSI